MSRYNDTRIKQNKDLNRVYSYTMYPRIPSKIQIYLLRLIRNKIRFVKK